MRKVILLLLAPALLGSLLQAQHTYANFNLSPLETTASTSSLVGAPAASYTSVSVTVSWSVIGQDPWSNEARFSLTNGGATTYVAEMAPTTGGAGNTSPTTLTFTATLASTFPGGASPLVFSARQTFGTTGLVPPYQTSWANISVVLSAAPISPPAVTTAFGTLADVSATYATPDYTASPTHSAGQIRWFSFVLGSGLTAGGAAYLDIDTNGSTGITDTELGLYSSSGALIASNDDSGSGLLSMLSFGSTVTVRGPTGTTGTPAGGEGPLVAGTYYLAVGGFNTTFGATGWSVTSNSTATGTSTVNLRFDSGVVAAAPEINVYAGSGTGGTLLVTPAAVTGINVGAAGTTLTYTVQNDAAATANLVMPASPLSSNVTVGAGTVSVTLGQPSTLSLAAGTFTTFTVTIASTISATGAAYTVQASLSNNDSNENPFVINISGNATYNNPPRANPGTGTPAFTGTADAGPFGFAANPGTAVTTSLLVDDVDTDDVQVVSITPLTAQAGITAAASAAGFGASRTVDFTGTLDANAAPGVYTWTIDIEDDQTPAGTRSITVNITLNNVAPVGTNTAILPTTGTGVDLANAYARSFSQTTTVASTDLFDVTDANLGQTLTIFSQTRTGGTGTTFPFNGQFAIAGSAGSFTVSVSTAGALVATDVGTHEYTLVIQDVAAGNQISVFVTLTVTAQTAPTFTPATGISMAQGTSQTGVVVGTAADAQDPFSALNVTATTVPAGFTVSAIAVNATNGEVTATIAVSTGATVGTNSITFTVTDSLSATGNGNFDVNVTANSLPIITAGPAVTMGTSASLTNRVIANVSDAEDAAGTLTVTVLNAPAGVAVSAIVNTAGEVRATVTTTSATAGANVVQLRVMDSDGATATANYTVTVSTGGGGGGGGGGSDGGGGCAASGSSSSLWLALFGLMAVAAISLRVRRSRA